MKKAKFFIVGLFVFLIWMPAFSEEEKVYYSSLLAKEPLLDGKLDEPAWKSIPEAANFVILGSASLAAKQTSFRIGYTDEAFYIGIKCEEPEVEKIKVKEGTSDFTYLWEEDSVEIFMFPKGAGNYYHFVVSSIGSRWNGIGKAEMPLLNWQVKSYKGKDFYSMEIRIPFEILYAIPRKNEKWHINIARNIYTPSGERYTCWSYLKYRFHDVDNFGKLTFSEEISEDKVKPKMAIYFKEKISVNLKILSGLKKELPEGEREISAFLEDYRNIERKISMLETFSIKEMQVLLRETKELIPRAEELKRKDSIRSFFDE